ncbi:hypothetical protein KKF82_08955 [Patescibacteria group bacterium]|nr:hypothetical protein [Patescibacteria group bacterium]
MALEWLPGLGIHTVRPTTILGNAGTHNAFTISGGPVLITGFWGWLTVLMDATLSTLRIEHEVGNVNLCGDLAAIADDAAGTLYYWTGVQAGLLLKAEAAVGGATPAIAAAQPVAAILGDIHITNGGNQTGSVEWHITWLPLREGSVLAPAAVY